MCGRFSLTATPRELADVFGLLDTEDFPARYNIAPTQPILVVIASDRQHPGSNLPERRALLVRWGLTPSWVKDPRDFPLLINARAETAVAKASFKAAMRHRRVLIPASGFYEWYRPPKDNGAKDNGAQDNGAKKSGAKGGGEASQPYWIRPRNGGIVAFAGLMETWSSADGSEVDTGAILTTRANDAISGIHDRMPVVIKPEDFARWLDCKTQEPRDVADLMVTAAEDMFETIAVSSLVNKVTNMGPDIQKPVADQIRPAARKTENSPLPADRQLSLF